MADLGGNDARRDSAGNALSDLVLDGKHIREIAIVVVDPEMVCALGLDQLGSDPDAIADALPRSPAPIGRRTRLNADGLLAIRS
jgi:hypothetical protein